MNSGPFVVFIVFLVLKLTDYIDWSWWWISAPLWVGAIIVIANITIDEISKSKRYR